MNLQIQTLNNNSDEKLSEEDTKNNLKYLEYINLFTPVILDVYPCRNKIIYNKFIGYLKNNKIMDYVHFVLDKRFSEICGELNSFFNERIPRTVFSYNELKGNLDLIDQLIDNEDRDSNGSCDEE